MKKTLLFKSIALSLFMLFGIGVVNAQTTINFDTDANWTQDPNVSSFGSYGNHSYTESGVTVSCTNVVRETAGLQDLFDKVIGTYAIRIRNVAGAKAQFDVASGGVSDFSIKVRRWDGSPLPDYTVKYSVDGGSIWTSLSNIDGTLLTTSDWFTYNGTINSDAGNILIEIGQTAATERIMIDDFTWTSNATPATDLFISEYGEGSASNDRVLEIFNGTGAAVDLSDYSVKQSYGGEGWGIRGGVAMIEYVLPLSGTLANGDVFVIYNSETTNAAIIAAGDLALTYTSGLAGCRNASFTGNDPMGLFKADVLIDAVGPEISAVGPWAVAGVTGATQDHTLVRKRTILEGNTDWAVAAGTNADDSEWVVYPVNYFDDLGAHTFGADLTAPSFMSVPTDGDTDVAVSTTIVLTFDEPIRNIDDSEITDLNVAALLTLKATDASGADVLYTATIDAAKMVITATPTSNLSNSQVYYAAIAPVEDIAGNATVESAMTFTTMAVIPVTFNVDMTGVTSFTPGTDILYIAGNIAGDWTAPGANAAFEMTDGDSDGIYTITLELTETGDIAYKYFMNAGWDGGEWTGDPNRSATIETTTTLNDVYGNYIYNVAITEAAPYYAGDVVNITWSSFGVTDVSIYAMMGSEAVGEIFTSTPSDGAEEFTIPTDAFGVNLYLRVSSIADSAFVFANGANFDVIGMPTIYEIQSNTSDGDLSVYNGAKVKITGIVTAIKGNNFWIQMPAGAADYPKWSGIIGYDAAFAAAVVIGDDVTLEASVEEYYNLTEIGSVTSYTINSQGNNIDPITVSAIDAGEAYESTLISFGNAEVLTVPSSYGEFDINDGTADYLVDDKIFAYTSTVGDILFISGVTSFSYGSFVLYPRSASDVIVSTLEVKDLSSIEMNIYPNPSNGKFFVEMGSAFKANTKIEVFNVVGMKVFETKVFDFKTEIDLNSMKQGVYYVRVDDGKNIVTRKLIKQ